MGLDYAILLREDHFVKFFGLSEKGKGSKVGVMGRGDFVHLHVHSEYSLLDGLARVGNIVRQTKEMGMKAVALSDHGVMHGAIEFYKSACAEGIKPIVGMEAFTTVGDHRKKEGGKDREYNHLLLLAKDEEGYKNLMKLATVAHLEGYYYRPRFQRALLAKYGKGLVCTTACFFGEVPRLIMAGEWEKAKGVAAWFQQVFGEDFYIEIQRHEYEKYVDSAKLPEVKKKLREAVVDEKKLNDGLVKLSREMGIPLVATNDVHYVKAQEAMAQDVLVCVATGKNVAEVNRLRYVDTPTFYLRSVEEMGQLFMDFPEAVRNTETIAEKCNLEISTLGKWFFPKVEVPRGLKAEEYLKELVREGIKGRFDKVTKELSSRLEYELEVICNKGYAPYFLIFRDMADWAREKGIPINTRGSAAGSLVSYVLGITTVDPIGYNLPFERFLNPFRPSLPDIDLDIADDRREEMISYLTRKYGKEKVARICTFGRMLARASVRDVARVLGYPYSMGDRIAKLIPFGSQGFPMTIERALSESQELRRMYRTEADVKKIVDLAMQVEGRARHMSVHAAGVVIAPSTLAEFVPLAVEPGGENVVTQYEMHACEDIGLVKMDVLGIRNLSILREAVERVKRERGVEIDLGKIPTDDRKSFEMLGRGETMGTFQLGGSGMTRYLVDLAPSRIEDLMAMIALFRPGPMANIPEYIARKKGLKPVRYFHPKMEKFLDKSYGILVYQDDLLFTALEVAGYTWESVDKFRKAVGKKIPEEMAKQHVIFVEGCMKHSGMSKGRAEALWKLFEPFQGYGFNKAHAASYGMVAYQTAYMKANYPVEFMVALLTAESKDADKVATAVAECRRMGIVMLPPDINESDEGFTVEANAKSLDGRAIRFGLSAIKNVGGAAMETIFTARQEGKFVLLTDFCRRVDNRKVNKRVLESLIKAGAMDRFGKRAACLAGLDKIREKCVGKGGGGGQTSLFGEEKVESVDRLPEVEEFSQKEMLMLEREMLGFYLSEHPSVREMTRVSHLFSLRLDEIDRQMHLGQSLLVGGVLSDMRVVMTKRGNKEMCFAQIRDGMGSLALVVFPETFASFRDRLVVDQVIVVRGKVDERGEELSFIVDEVKTPDELLASDSERTDEVVLSLSARSDPQIILQLSEVLKRHKGEKKVRLKFVNGTGRVRQMEVPFGVAWDEDLARLVEEVLKRGGEEKD